MKCLFCEFISGKQKKHKNGFPVIKINETKNSYIFLSIPEKIAKNKGSDILIIPKKHYKSIGNISEESLTDLIINIKKASRILIKKFGGSRIIINNGINAGQYIPHAHFHIVPIVKGGKNPWENLTLEQYKKISNELKIDYIQEKSNK